MRRGAAGCEAVDRGYHGLAGIEKFRQTGEPASAPIAIGRTLRGRTLAQGELRTLAVGVPVSRPCQRHERACAGDGIGRGRTGLPEVTWSRRVADLMFGVPELEQDQRSISRGGWLIERPP
jgi:hypothetical protein